MIKRILVAAAALAFATGIHSAYASDVYDGNNVEFQYYAYGSAYNDDGSPATFSAPGSTEFSPYFNVSVSGDQITYTYLTDTTWAASTTSLDQDGLYVDNGAVIYSVSGEPGITSVTLDPSSILGSSGFSSGDITYNSDAVAVTWMNLPFTAGDTVVLDVNGVSGTPEPSTWTLMIAGVGVMGAALRFAARYKEASGSA